MKAIGLCAALLAAALAVGCTSSARPRNSGIYLLLDTSGTYRQELDKAEQIINYTLARLEPNDSFAVARIDTGSFSEKDIIAKVTIDDRPSTANMQKRQFSKTVAAFLDEVEPARHTDITGGLLQAVEFLNEKDTGRKTVLIFSDLEEDLEEGYVRDISVPLRGFEIVALNVMRAPAHGGHDSGVMADSVPAAWRTVFRPDGGDFGPASGMVSAMASEGCPPCPE